jgi:hypothetical protein
MKTLKQIREECGSSTQEIDFFEDNMLESKGEKLSTGIPSSKEMPVLLMFRRIQYRIYPDKQVVALYYSKMIDKYLSVPFGPKGNINLSEAVLHDDIEEGTTWETLKGAAKGAVAGARGGLAGMATGALAGGVKGYIKGKSDELKASARQSKQPQEKSDSGESTSSSQSSTSGFKRPLGSIKTGSSWKASSNKSDAVFQSRLKTATAKELKQSTVNENKINKMRQMIKENIETDVIEINGKTITLNNSMAKRILEVYDSVNSKNKKIVENMLNDDLESFKRLLTFSIRN